MSAEAAGLVARSRAGRRDRAGRRGSATRAFGLTALTVGGSVVLGVLLVRQPAIFWLLVGAGGGMVLAYLAARHPGAAIVAIVGLGEIYPFILAQLASAGAPVSSVLAASYWKDIVVLTLGAMVIAAGTSRWQLLDRTIVAYLALLLAYVVLPGTTALLPHLIAVREDGALFLVFLAARHLAVDQATYRRLELAILVTAVAFAAVAVWNHFSPADYAAWLGNLYGPLRNGRPAALITEVVNGTSFVRAGSVFQSPLDLAYYLAIPIGLVIARLAEGRSNPWFTWSAVICGAGLLLSLTRSAILTVPVMVGIALLGGRRRGAMATVSIAGALVLLPVALASGLGARLGLATNLADPGTAGHVNHVADSIARIGTHPLGLGLATAGDLSARFMNAGGPIYNDSWYFQISTEIGVAGLLLFVAVLVLVFRELWRRTRAGAPHALGALLALVAVCAGGLVLHTFQNLPTAWAVMALAGLACSVHPVSADSAAAGG